MVTPERINQSIDPLQATAELKAHLNNIDDQLERADGNENTIERYFKREQLLELQGKIEEEIASISAV